MIGIDIEGSDFSDSFSFGGWGHDGFYYFGNDSNGSIEKLFVFVAKVVEPTSSTSSFGGDEVSCIAVGGKDHIIACLIESLVVEVFWLLAQ